jgi:hypothetical protein
VGQPDPVVGPPEEDKQEGEKGDYDGERDADGKRHGHGFCRWQDGTTYNGEWRHGKRHGQGTLKMQNGTNLTGRWEDDTFMGEKSAKKGGDGKFSSSFLFSNKLYISNV